VTVLGSAEIDARLDDIFSQGTADPRRIRAAKYDLTLGERVLILPDGKRYWETKGYPRRRPFTLNQGETALVSTKERLTMPLDLAGIFGPTFGLSNLGIFFSGGMLVDPGFGRSPEGVAEPISLTFHLTNISEEPLQLRPDIDRIASISFFPVMGSTALSGPDPAASSATQRMKEERDEIFDSNDLPSRSVYAIKEVADIGKSLDKVKASVEQVVLFGVILLSTTLVAIMATLVVNENSDGLATMTWLETGGAIGAAICEIALLVGLFYAIIPITAKLFGRRRR
jgi:deoxycytidine triphosphate deaminase